MDENKPEKVQVGEPAQPGCLQQGVDCDDPAAVISYLHGVGAELQGLNPDNAKSAVRYAVELLAWAHSHALRCRQIMLLYRGPQSLPEVHDGYDGV